MKVGLYAPLFHDDESIVRNFAECAEDNGMDGVFVFDHSVMGSANLTSLHFATALETMLTATESMSCGSLVARVDADNTPQLVRSFGRLGAVGAQRLIAGLGVGDRSVIEREKPGAPVAPFSDRVDAMRRIGEVLVAGEAEVWIGGRSKAVATVARDLEAPLNLWEQAAGERPEDLREVTWAGRTSREPTEITNVIERCDHEGYSWAILLIEGTRNEPSETVRLLAECKESVLDGH